MAEVTDGEFRQVQKFMKELAFTHTDEWLLACMNWVKEDNPSVTFDVFKREIAAQWKDANLEEMESSCLPVNLAGQKLAKLTGTFGLQVNSMQDIGESAYSQWSKLKKLDNENATVAATDSNEFKQTWQPTPKRCLFLTMTDGSQLVKGLEIQTLPGISLNMKPGFKVIIKGPLDCRRGVMHLKPGNVKVVGGEVEALLESNRMEKILADTLKIPPGTARKLPPTQTQQAPSSSRPTNTTQLSSASSRSTATSSQLPLSTNNFTPAEEVFGEFPDSDDPFPEIGEDDDIFMDIDEEAIIQSAASKATVSSSNRNGRPVAAAAPSRGTSQMTTQGVNSCSNRTSFTEEIEDFDDEPPVAIQPVARTNRPATNPTTKPKSVFVPPIKQTQASKSSCPSEKRNITTEFKTAKAAQSTSSSNSTSTGKQLDITQFMKPMPVIIDPPTPQRQLKRRRRTIEEGETAPPNPADDAPKVKVESPELDDFDMMVGTPDESLFQIVDDTLESKLKESGYTSQSTPKPSKTYPSYPVTVPETPFVYLAQVKQQIADFVQQRKVVHVKACVSTVVSNISIDAGCWTLVVSINDGTDYLNCRISSAILSQIIGFTPAEMKRIKAVKSPEGKKQITEGLQNLTTQLVHMNAVFAIEIGDMPMITEVLDLKLHHAAALKSRLFKIGL